MSLVIVELLSDSATADDYRFGGFGMSVDRDGRVAHQDIEHSLGRILGRCSQIVIHSAARRDLGLLLNFVKQLVVKAHIVAILREWNLLFDNRLLDAINDVVNIFV